MLEGQRIIVTLTTEYRKRGMGSYKLEEWSVSESLPVHESLSPEVHTSSLAEDPIAWTQLSGTAGHMHAVRSLLPIVL